MTSTTMKLHNEALFHSCPRCAEEVQRSAKFCHGCGLNLARAALFFSISARHIFGVIALAAALWGVGWFMQAMHGGTKPTAKFEEQQSDIAQDPMLSKLRAAAEGAPNDLQNWLTYASHVVMKISEHENPPPELALEAVDALSKVLSINPNETSALLMMADVSFTQQAFPKAAEFYTRYLALVKDDLDARTKLGTSLSFMGEFKKGIAELESVVKIDPKHFQAMAYLAVAYAQAGDKNKAIEIGENSLAIAPSTEARARFAAFIDSVREGKFEAISTDATSSENALPSSSPLAELSQSIAKNPVAGPKFSHLEIKSAGELALYFKDFPMNAMPEFAKEKFFSGIKGKISELKLEEIKSVVFVELGTGKEMEKIFIEPR